MNPRTLKHHLDILSEVGFIEKELSGERKRGTPDILFPNGQGLRTSKALGIYGAKEGLEKPFLKLTSTQGQVALENLCS